MARKLVQIDESKCNGCGLCASACHEGAIGMVNGKAKLLKKNYATHRRLPSGMSHRGHSL